MAAPDRASTHMLTGSCAPRPTKFIVPADWQSMFASVVPMFKLMSVQKNIALKLPRPSKACARNLTILTAYIATVTLPSAAHAGPAPQDQDTSPRATGLVFAPMCARVQHCLLSFPSVFLV